MNAHAAFFTCIAKAAVATSLAVTLPASLSLAQIAPASPPLHLTVADAVARALDTSHRIGEGVAREEAATAAVAGRAAADMPVFSVLGGYTRTNHVDEYRIPQPGGGSVLIYPDVPDNWRARVDVQWPVYTSGRFSALERAASAEAGAANREVGAVRSDVRLDATRAFWTLAMAIEAERVVGESLKRIESHLHDVRTMLDVGLLAPNDVLSVEARRSRERVLLIEAVNARNVADADLKRVTGIPADVTVVIDVPELDAPPDVPAATVLVQEARNNRTERQALQLRIQSLGERQVAAGAALKPVVAVVGGAEYARPNPRVFPRAPEWNPSFDVGVNVAWSFWDGGKVKADMAEIDAGRRAAEQRLAEFDRTLDFEITQRRLDHEAARAAIIAASDGVTAAAEAHRVVTERFKAGLVSNTEVLDAQVDLVQAQLERTRAVTAARLALARLDRALGR